MKKNLVYLFVLLVTTLKTFPASAAWKNLVICDNGVSIFIDTTTPSRTLYKADIRNKNVIKNLGITNPASKLELLETSFYPPQIRRLKFSTKGTDLELKISQLDRGNLFSFEVVSPQEITCAQEACTSGCYAGDTAVWDCVDLRVTPESTLYNETSFCKIELSK
ncbi:MAG: hypothetical protein ACOYL6_17620 [Bacteriovoracaceae bacterium]